MSSTARRPRDASLEMIRRLVGFATVSRDSNLELIEYVLDILRAHGVPDARLTFDDERRKANLFATIGPAGRPGIVLSGHTDVVPVEGQAWSTDPFRVVERDARLYGRGTADMKSFVAVVLAMLPQFLARELRTPLHLAFSYDEEVGCLGVRRLIADLADAGIRPAACIVGEPTLMRPVVAHKSKHSWRCTVHGHASHSAYAPHGVNAVEAACELVAYLKRMQRRLRLEGPYRHDYDVPHTTVHTGLIRGGTQLNIVPHECTFDFEFRCLPGADPEAMMAELRRYAEDELLPEMRAVQPASRFEWHVLSIIPGLDADPDDEVVRLARGLSGLSDTGKVSYGTEAGLFQVAGIPSVICGPGSIEQAHKPDEYVSLEQVVRCEEFLLGLLERVAA
jgi:acetylornithine deacetylase